MKNSNKIELKNFLSNPPVNLPIYPSLKFRAYFCENAFLHHLVKMKSHYCIEMTFLSSELISIILQRKETLFLFPI